MTYKTEKRHSPQAMPFPENISNTVLLSRPLWGLILGFFVSLIALCFSIVIYDSDANHSIVKVTLIINGIALICNIYNTIIQSIYARENPTGIAETPDAAAQSPPRRPFRSIPPLSIPPPQNLNEIPTFSPLPSPLYAEKSPHTS